MGTTWQERQTATPEERRLYEQERLVLWATEMLSDEMERAGVSRAALAERLGTSRANVTGLLSGGRNMTLRTLADVAGVLGMRVEIALHPLPAVSAPDPAASTGEATDGAPPAHARRRGGAATA
jgi:transcriptional regulator with XRE-family HTH domain